MSKRTPEGKIKEKVVELLQEYNVYYYRPVQFGYGPAGLDFHCVLRVGSKIGNIPIAFFIETKIPDDWITDRQSLLIKKLNEEYSAKVFIVQDERDMERLRRWLEKIRQANLLKEVSSPTTISPLRKV